MPGIPAYTIWEDQEFETSLGYIAILYVKKKNKQNNNPIHFVMKHECNDGPIE
jgi:hypothetical protein